MVWGYGPGYFLSTSQFRGTGWEKYRRKEQKQISFRRDQRIPCKHNLSGAYLDKVPVGLRNRDIVSFHYQIAAALLLDVYLVYQIRAQSLTAEFSG